MASARGAPNSAARGCGRESSACPALPSPSKDCMAKALFGTASDFSRSDGAEVDGDCARAAEPSRPSSMIHENDQTGENAFIKIPCPTTRHSQPFQPESLDGVLKTEAV